MKTKDVKPGTIYVLKDGAVGKCLRIFNCTPPKPELQVVWPFPRISLFKPGDLVREAAPEDVPEQIREKLFPKQ